MADSNDFEDVDIDPESVSRDPGLLADDRAFSGPTFAYQRIEPDFLSLSYVDRFERVEDFNLGEQLNTSVTFSPKALGSENDTLLIAAGLSNGLRLSRTAFTRGELGTTLRLDHRGFENVVISGRLQYYDVMGPLFASGLYLGRHTLGGALALDVGESLDRDREFLLGAASGLRGYESYTFSGDHRLRLNLEHRVHLVEDIFRLFNLGGAVFFDAGGTSRSSVGSIISQGLYADFGVGLRIGLPRSSGGNVVRIDLAFPLRNGPDGSVELEPRLLFTTGQAFSAALRSDSFGSGGSDVTVKFLP